MSTCVGSACDFAREYELALAEPMLEIERKVQGGDYGASSWTTRAQADALVAALGLRPGVRLLEIGAGAGWPALPMAQQSGCDVILADLPLSGLQAARARARRDGLAGRAALAAASGAALPFAERSFDAITHSDVLCCLLPKLRMLQECRRVARSRAGMAFFVISLAREPRDEDERSLLERSGPPYPQAPAGYRELLQEAGWQLREHQDVTAEFSRCMQVMLSECEANSAALSALWGVAEATARLERRRCTARALELGLLQREFCLAG